jgi:hypothetical protein
LVATCPVKYVTSVSPFEPNDCWTTLRYFPLLGGGETHTFLRSFAVVDLRRDPFLRCSGDPPLGVIPPHQETMLPIKQQRGQNTFSPAERQGLFDLALLIHFLPTP